MLENVRLVRLPLMPVLQSPAERIATKFRAGVGSVLCTCEHVVSIGWSSHFVAQSHQMFHAPS